MPRQGYNRIRLTGTMGDAAAPPEIFSYGFSLSTDPAVNHEEIATKITPLCQAFHGDVATAISTRCILREVTVARIGEDNRQIGETARRAVNTPGGNTSTGVHPFSVAWRVTMDTGLRGRSQRGGFYLPMPAVSLDAASGLTTAAAAQALLDRLKTFVLAVEAIDYSGDTQALKVVIASIQGNQDVSRLRVGRRLDTIRSRNTAVGEAYVTTTV